MSTFLFIYLPRYHIYKKDTRTTLSPTPWITDSIKIFWHADHNLPHDDTLNHIRRHYRSKQGIQPDHSTITQKVIITNPLTLTFTRLERGQLRCQEHLFLARKPWHFSAWFHQRCPVIFNNVQRTLTTFLKMTTSLRRWLPCGFYISCPCCCDRLEHTMP